MARKQLTPEQIIGNLRAIEVCINAGMAPMFKPVYALIIGGQICSVADAKKR